MSIRELTQNEVIEVSGGVDLDWGAIGAEVFVGAATGAGLGSFGRVGRFIPYGVPIVAIVGAAISGYKEVIKQVEKEDTSEGGSSGS